MKKLFVLLALVFLVSGCVKSNNYGLEELIDKVLLNDVDLANQYFAGYQYYLPREVSIIDKYDYNTLLKYRENKIYLYVDIIAYYHKTTEDYEINPDLYYSKVFENNDKKGYINIDKKDDNYYIEIAYNYGKIEVYSNEENLYGTVINSCYILKTLKFNDVVIDSLIGENKIEYQEEKFDLYKSDASDNNYLDAIDDYDNYVVDDEEVLIDEDSIDLEDDDDLKK